MVVVVQQVLYKTNYDVLLQSKKQKYAMALITKWYSPQASFAVALSVAKPFDREVST